MKNEVKAIAYEDLGSRIFAKDVIVSNNVRETGLNNNDLLVGTPGSGKTGGYVIPNLSNPTHSIVVADAKGQLYKAHAERLRSKGFRVETFDFIHPEHSASYNPMDYIKRNGAGYRENDLMSIAKVLIPDDVDKKETFWADSARNVLVSLIAYCIEMLLPEEQHLGSVCRLYDEMTSQVDREARGDNWNGVDFFNALEKVSPNSFAVRMYHKYSSNFAAERCWASITQFVANALVPFEYEGNAKMFNRQSSLLFHELGRQKTILFVNVSDTDRAMDALINLFYTQLFQSLCAEADQREDGRLAVPVRIILDDFATNVVIENFDKIISNIRSREIYTTVILQDIAQLDGMYVRGKARTIINNCDHILYLGGQDDDTARFFAIKSRKLPETILELPLTDAWFFERGQRGIQVEKVRPYDPKYMENEVKIKKVGREIA